MLLVSCPYDFGKNNAFLIIKWDVDAGQISTNYNHKWARNLLDEYLAYLKNSFKITVMNLDSSWGINETFVKADYPYPLEYGLHVQGDWAFSLLQNEAGIHKLQQCEEKSGAECQVQVEVVPEVSVDYFDTHYDGGGLRISVHPVAGVSSPTAIIITDSGVSIRHVATGIKAYSFTEKSQLPNRKLAVQIILGRLYMHEQNALSNPNIIREYDLEKKTIKDRRLSKAFKYSEGIRDVLPEIFEEHLLNRINSIQ